MTIADALAASSRSMRPMSLGRSGLIAGGAAAMVVVSVTVSP